MAEVTRLQPANYDSRTDRIDAVGAPKGREHVKAVNRIGYTVIEPVMGWGPYTHLIEVDTFDHHQVYLAHLAD